MISYGSGVYCILTAYKDQDKKRKELKYLLPYKVES